MMFGLDFVFLMNFGLEVVDLVIKVVRKWGYNVKGIEFDEVFVVIISNNYYGKILGFFLVFSN